MESKSFTGNWCQSVDARIGRIFDRIEINCINVVKDHSVASTIGNSCAVTSVSVSFRFRRRVKNVACGEFVG